jgi:hypothetical protein
VTEVSVEHTPPEQGFPPVLGAALCGERATWTTTTSFWFTWSWTDCEVQPLHPTLPLESSAMDGLLAA